MKPRSSLDVHAWLSDHRRYERQIERLHKRYLFTPQFYELRQDGVSLASLSLHQSELAKLLARTVGRAEYRFEPASVRTISSDGKRREVFALRLTDLIVHGVVADLIQEAMAPCLSPRLFSYRPGVSWWTPVSAFAAYMRAHRRSHPDPRSRGVYVLRRDIDAYTDSIPVGGRSRVWQMLRDLLDPQDRMMRAADWELVERVVRPEAYIEPGRLCTLFRGVPTGQPISCILFNLYLSGFDRELAAVPGAFYARYSDDIVFAHPDPGVVRGVDARAEALLADLGLTVSGAKRRDLYLTGAGRASSEWPGARGTTWAPLLGCRISADGTVSLNRKKVRRLLRDLEERAGRTATAMRGASQERVGRVVCSVINRVIDPRTPVFQQRSAALLRRAVTDRPQLRQLDHWIARIVLGAVTGRPDVRAFRELPYRKIRTEWRLVSLVHARNRWPRSEARR